MFKKWIIGGMAIGLIAILFIAAKPQGMTHLNSLWIGAHSDTAATTPGDNDLQVSGIITMGTADLSKNKRIAVQLASVFQDGGNDADDASTPTLTETDNVGSLVYDSSAETTGFQFSWPPSANYQSGMQIEVAISSDTADGTAQYLDWSVFVQDTDSAFGVETDQTGALGTSATLDASNEVVTLSLDATGEALITAGTSVVTIELWSSPVVGCMGTTEIKTITILEPVL